MVRATRCFFGSTGKLGQRNDRNVQFLGHNFQVPGDIADFLHAAFGALGGLHQLQIVDDDQTDLIPFGVLVDLADFCLDFRHRNTGGIIHVNGNVIQQ